MADQNPTQNLLRIAGLLGLLLVLWGVISFIFGCNFLPIPMNCDVYYGILHFSENGQPKILIVYGDEGMGNHELLQRTMENPSILGLHPRSVHIDTISVGNLREYDLVIVEQARKISTDKLKMFMEYVNFGGRLVWTGDAGTELSQGDERLTEFERGNDNNSDNYASGWGRKESGKVVAFDEFLGVDYLGNFCQAKTCLSTPYIGLLEAPERQNKFVYSIRPGLKMYGDFSLVKLRGDAPSKVLLNVDLGGGLLANPDFSNSSAAGTQENSGGAIGGIVPATKRNLGKIFPVVVQNGFGGRIIYYSIPPDFFVSEGMPVDPETGQRMRYTSFIENLYYGYFG